MKKISYIFLSLISLLAIQHSFAYQESKDNCEIGLALSRYTYSWEIQSSCKSKTRGGTTKGAPLTLAEKPRTAWTELQAKNLTKKEQDRRAILAMAGTYKVNFDFLEVVGFGEDYQRDLPYQSWGTEEIYVVEDKPDFISLQHIMVMYFTQEDGSISEPMVMKHWRQDWTYEDPLLLEYSHGKQWNTRKTSKQERKGAWSQAVFQVDDSPRYESIGRWEHNPSFSTWISAKTRRPLPRREYSVRKDYDLLEGFNRHTVTRHGWVQDEENWKLDVDEKGQADSKTPYLSKEQGFARYRSLQDFDVTEGDKYWKLTKPYWDEVRQQWDEIISSSKIIKVSKKIDDQPLFSAFFSYASEITKAGKYNPVEGKAYVAKILAKAVKKK